MDRRELMKYLAASSVAGAVLSSRKLEASQVLEQQITMLSTDRLPPLSAPAEGKLPVAFVIGKDAEVLDFCGPLEVFAQAWTKDDIPLFAPYMVSGTMEPVKVGGGMRVLPDYTYKDAPAPKIIVIPAMNMEGLPPDMFDWIREASTKTDITMSACNGAFVLAKTGLLAGKRCTAHHGGYFRFAGMFPDVKLVRGARFVEDGKFASAVGSTFSGYSVHARILPYLELGSLYSQIDFALGYAAQPAICKTKMPVYRCPSDPEDENRIDGGVEFAPTNYGFNIGTWLGLDLLTAKGGDGAFGYNMRHNFSAITDGLSNTLCTAEVKSFTPALLDGGQPAAPFSPPPDTPAQVIAFGGTFDKDYCHTQWVTGRTLQSGITTTFPPNTKVLYTTAGIVYDVDFTSARVRNEFDQLVTKGRRMVYATAARIAPHGTVVIQAKSISITFLHFACFVLAPIPSSDPTLTCVVLTGRL